MSWTSRSRDDSTRSSSTTSTAALVRVAIGGQSFGYYSCGAQHLHLTRRAPLTTVLSPLTTTMTRTGADEAKLAADGDSATAWAPPLPQQNGAADRVRRGGRQVSSCGPASLRLSEGSTHLRLPARVSADMSTGRGPHLAEPDSSRPRTREPDPPLRTTLLRSDPNPGSGRSKVYAGWCPPPRLWATRHSRVAVGTTDIVETSGAARARSLWTQA
jgi:hypothetical protein